MAKSTKDNEKQGPRTVASNRKAHHEYFIEENFEAGIVLTGTEIKSARAGKGEFARGVCPHSQWRSLAVECAYCPF